jgi:hypothetical protein
MKVKLFSTFLLLMSISTSSMAESCYEIYKTPWVGSGHSKIFKCEVDGQVCVINMDQGGVACFPKPKIKK